MEPTPYLKKLFEQESNLEAAWREQLDEHPLLGQTSWTAEQIHELDVAHDAHIYRCSACQIKLGAFDEEDHDIEECSHSSRECYMESYCQEGQRTLRAWLDASQEYSWQEDFEGNA